MFFYRNWKRYSVTEDRSLPKKTEAVVWLLTAMDELRLTVDQVTSIIPFSFLERKKYGLKCPLSIDALPHLRLIIHKTKVYGNNTAKEVKPTASELYIEAYRFLQDTDWVYASAPSYKAILQDHFDLVDTVEGKEYTPHLVPGFIKNLELGTYITEEVNIETIDN